MVGDTAKDTLYLDNLDEFINDEGKIVTYKWLSFTLNVHTNVAKQMLYHFVTSQRNSDKGDGLSVTYMVSGVMAGEGDHPDVHQIMLVQEENLATVKSRMKDVISVHIYSVQKTKLQDINILYTANYDTVKENIMNINRYSGIECSEAKVRSSADLAKIQQQNAYHAPPEPARIESKYKPSQIKKEPGTENGVKHSKNSSRPGGQSNQIASMFARQAKKSEEMKDEGIKPGKDSKKTPPSAGSKTKAGISAFFNKGSAPKKPQTPESAKSSLLSGESSKPSPITTESSESSPTKSHTDMSSPLKTASAVSSPSKAESQDSTKEFKVDFMDIDSPTKETKVQSKNNSKSKETKIRSKIKPNKAPQCKRKTKRSEDNDDHIPKTKRKRNMHFSDSESSSEEEDQGDEEQALPSSPPPPEHVRIESDSDEDIPATPQPDSVDLLNKEGRKQKRKLVDKTFMDEEGFFVTKKEYEYVDDSGEEDAVSPKTETFPENKTETSPTKTSPTKTDSAPQTTTKNLPQAITKKSPKKKSTAIRKPKASDSNKKQSVILNYFTRK